MYEESATYEMPIASFEILPDKALKLAVTACEPADHETGRVFCNSQDQQEPMFRMLRISFVDR